MECMSFLSKRSTKTKNKNAEPRHEIEKSVTHKSIEDVNCGLGFADVFSDRVLRLEIEKSLTDLEVETLSLSSLMLAAKSPFFYKLFNNGGKDSDKFTVRIDASEKAAFMDLLNSVYNRPLTASSRDELMDVIMAADKFEVTSCAKQCVQLLIKSHMTVESAPLYLKFHSTLFVVGEVTRPLVDAAKHFLSSHFSGFTESQQEEAMSLPLSGIEAVVAGANFHARSEEDVLDFMLKWARKTYPNLEERRDILSNRLLGLTCLPCMSILKLKEVMDCPEFDSVKVAKLAFSAFLDNHSPDSIPTKDAPQNCAFPMRAHIHRRVVFFDIRKQDCIAMVTNSTRIKSEVFYLGGRQFCLFAQRYKKEGSSTEESLGLFVEMKGSGSCSLTSEYAAMKKPSNEFETLPQCSKVLTETQRNWGFPNLLKMPWTTLMGDAGNDYIIDGVIRIRVQLTLTK